MFPLFPLFDKFNEENFNIATQELNQSVRNLSSINKPYTELGTLKTWIEGEQEADENLNIISRRYAELLFDNEASDFDFNDVGFNDDTYGGRYYWRILHKFTEHEYYSESTAPYQDFLIWEESNNRFQMDIIYKHELIKSLDWIRPRTEQTLLPTSNNENNPTCPINGSTPPTNNETGDSNWITINNNTNSSITCRKYLSVSIPYYKIFDVGGALGATLLGDLPDNVYLFDIKPSILNTPNINLNTLIIPLLENVDYTSINPITIETALESILTERGIMPVNNAGTYEDPYRLNQRFLLLEYRTPTNIYPKEGSINLYGVEYYRSFLPLSKDNNPLLPEHAIGTNKIAHTNNNTTITRYKPPGRMDFPDNFWNDINIDTINSFGERVGKEGEEI